MSDIQICSSPTTKPRAAKRQAAGSQRTGCSTFTKRQYGDVTGWQRWYANGLALIVAGALAGACDDTPADITISGSLSGQVVVSGPLRGASVSIDQIETRDPAMSIRNHVADAITDDQGRFSIESGIYSGLFLVTATGGSFVDLSTGATI